MAIAFASSVSAWRSDNVITSAIVCCCAQDDTSAAVVALNLSPWEPDSAMVRPRWCAFTGAFRIHGKQNERSFPAPMASESGPAEFKNVLKAPASLFDFDVYEAAVYARGAATACASQYALASLGCR
jgi:hypothetical protein